LHYAAQLSTPSDANNPQSPDGIARGLQVIDKLLSKQVDVDCRDEDQRTPLLWAASAGLY
jgi:ankyrin repeat protein